MLSADGFSPPVVKTSESAPSEAAPAPVSAAPVVVAELSQPRFNPPCGFPHGQVITLPTPGSHIETIGLGVVGSRSPAISAGGIWPVTMLPSAKCSTLTAPGVHPGCVLAPIS